MQYRTELSLSLKLILFAFIIFSSAVASVLMGHDANWDLRNYHIYNAFAFLDWRYDVDIMPVGIQTLFNPLLDIPYYLISRTFGLQAATLFQSLYYSILVIAAFLLNHRIFGSLPLLRGRNVHAFACAAFTTLLGVTGAAAFSQIATTFNEVQLAALIVCGLACIVGTLDQPGPRHGRMSAAGALFGVAAGLKLTAALYAPACVVALVFAMGMRRGGVAALYFMISFALALICVFGWWGLFVYQKFGNPIFPLYNALFHSPWFPPVNEIDDRFMPRNAAEWIAYPFNWAFDAVNRTTEPAMRDPRLALLLVSASGVLLAFRPVIAASEKLKYILVFCVMSYVLWLRTFSILRYAIPIEVISGTFVCLLLLLVLPSRRGAAIAMAATLVAVQSLTVYPSWERMGFSRNDYGIDVPALPDNSLVITESPPVGYILPFIDGKRLGFLNGAYLAERTRGYRLSDEIRSRIAGHRGPIFVIGRGGPNAGLMAEFGIAPVPDECRVVSTQLEPSVQDIRLCPARKL